MVKIIAEIGINHNGSLEECKKMIMLAKVAGCDYAKIPQIVGHFYSPEDEEVETTDELLHFHKQIDKYAKDHGTKIWNVVDEGFESPVFEAIDKKKVANLLKK